jgi:UDP-N-acetylglucosamine diphosphorylase/glucosamine-1-phosphate N-acetyltransferase
VVILAAGKGTRMKSDIPKVLHPIHGRPMLDYVVGLAERLGSARTVVVVGYGAEEVKEAMASHNGLGFALQEPQLGTGHAMMAAAPQLQDFGGSVLVLYGDVPCLQLSTAQALLDRHAEQGNDLTVLAMEVGPDNAYGRLVTDGQDRLRRIVETRDATEAEKAISLASSGIFVFRAKRLLECLPLLTTDNDQNEYYLTDLVQLFDGKGYRVGYAIVKDPDEVAGVNSLEELSCVEQAMSCLTGGGGV